MIILGATDSSYYCLLVHRTQPGNYYVFFDSVYIARFANSDNTLEERRLIRSTTSTRNDDHWNQKDTTIAFDIVQYLGDRNIINQFPSDELDSDNFMFRNNQLYLQKDENTSLLVDSTALVKPQDALLQNTTWMTNNYRHLQISSLIRKARVVEYFATNSFYYFVIRTGGSSYDESYFQFVVPVAKHRVDDIIKRFGKE